MDGILNLNKPAGFTSFDCVAIARRLTGERKIGHTGTLDPEATGVLPLCIGKATRLLEYMDDMPKTYVCTCRLGLVTDTRDIWGEILQDRRAEIDSVSREMVESGLSSFLGEIMQKPPVFSAIKINGKKLYEYARAGKEVEVPERKVTIHEIELLEWNGPREDFVFKAVCSRGTYIRSICHDLGEILGCGACMSGLVRTETCGYRIEDAVDMETFRSMNQEDIAKLLDPLETAVSGLPRLELDERTARLFKFGNPVWSENIACPEGNCAVFYEDKLLGIAKSGKVSKVIPE
ncbi:MAG: tRNA pseudouridine(55) synthase TruB [Clostridia bacterium]|nr:tRNA pseudouridine(55) synthase TruB [Clostridia bacterium]